MRAWRSARSVSSAAEFCALVSVVDGGAATQVRPFQGGGGREHDIELGVPDALIGGALIAAAPLFFDGGHYALFRLPQAGGRSFCGAQSQPAVDIAVPRGFPARKGGDVTSLRLRCWIVSFFAI